MNPTLVHEALRDADTVLSSKAVQVGEVGPGGRLEALCDMVVEAFGRAGLLLPQVRHWQFGGSANGCMPSMYGTQHHGLPSACLIRVLVTWRRGVPRPPASTPASLAARPTLPPGRRTTAR